MTTCCIACFEGELNYFLSCALGAGPLFDVSEESDYVQTLLGVSSMEDINKKSESQSNAEGWISLSKQLRGVTIFMQPYHIASISLVLMLTLGNIAVKYDQSHSCPV